MGILKDMSSNRWCVVEIHTIFIVIAFLGLVHCINKIAEKAQFHDWLPIMIQVISFALAD
jgi:uncharacterized membrane protein YeiH